MVMANLEKAYEYMFKNNLHHKGSVDHVILKKHGFFR